MHYLSSLFGHPHPKTIDSFTLSAADYKTRFFNTNTAHKLIDVRSAAEFAAGHLVGARNIPLPELTEQLESIPRDMPVMLYCRTGNRSGQALNILQMAGYTDAYNIGGLSDLDSRGVPVTVRRVIETVNQP